MIPKWGSRTRRWPRGGLLWPMSAPEAAGPAANRLPRTATWSLAVLALALVVYFDLHDDLSLGDEWIYRWPATYLASGHGLHLWPGVGPPALIQILVTTVPALLHPAARWLRLSMPPFSLLQVYFSWRLARQLGADHFWSAVAAVLLVLAPIGLAMETGLMSDPSYLALMLGALSFGVDWVLEGRGRAWCVILAALAALERQHGYGLPVAVTVRL